MDHASPPTGGAAFIPPAMPADEVSRLAALRDLKILDTPPEERFDRVVRLAATLFNVPIAYISLVDANRQWFKSHVGADRQETPRDISFCGHAILQDEALVVSNALEDRRFAGNPLVVNEPFVRFYAGQPVRAPEGMKIGTLCLMDKQPRTFTGKDRELLSQLAKLVEHEFQLVDVIGLQEEMLRVKEELIESQKSLAIEKEKADNLLLNILPAKVADELKEHGRVRAQYHDDVCVMFTDFSDFTEVAERFSASDLVAELNHCFSGFDEITGQHNVEKLKTIGDGYLCVSGIPDADASAALNLARTAIAIRDQVARRKMEMERKGKPYWNIRIGIHSGPLVAGVVGSRKFAFDVWGDTVNLASRLESSGEPGKINISQAFYDKVNPLADCSERGPIAIKGKGEMEMYFLNGLRK